MLALRALAIGLFVVAAVNVPFWIANGWHLEFAEDFLPLVIQTAMVATPFLILALFRVRDRLPWLVGLVLTACFWGYLVFRHLGDGLEIDIHLAIALLASPIVISFCCVLAMIATRRKSS